jgi:hypothetical protein
MDNVRPQSDKLQRLGGNYRLGQRRQLVFDAGRLLRLSLHILLRCVHPFRRLLNNITKILFGNPAFGWM